MFMQPYLSQFAASIRDIWLLSFDEQVAHYLLTRNVNSVNRGYHAYFGRDRHGVWKLIQF